MDICADERGEAMHNEWSDYPRSLPGEALDFLKQWEHLLVNQRHERQTAWGVGRGGEEERGADHADNARYCIIDR